MADISKLSRLVAGVQRQVDLSSNTLVVGSLKVGTVSPTELTKTILDRLVSLQNGSDVDATYHTHDGRYFTETELGSSGASSGSDLIGDDNTYSNFTPAAATVKGALSGIDAALADAAGTSFSDADFEIYDDGDPTKLIKFQASAITTGTTRTITMPDANVDLGKIATAIQRDGSVAFTANQPMGGFKLTGLAAGSTAGDSVRYEQAILASGANAFAANQSFGGFKATNLADPTANQDAATKAYVDSLASGLDPKASVRAATTAALPACTYDNGASGVGATLTADANGALPAQDGITMLANQRLLVKNQAAALQNGIYNVTQVGDGSNPFILTRATDQDGSPTAEVSGGNFTFVEAGTTLEGSGWSVIWDGEVTIGTDPLDWSQFSSIAFIGGDMVTLTGNTISVDLATTSGLESTNPGNVAGQLRIKLEASNPSLQITGSNELAAKLAAGGAISSGASGLSVNVDNSTIEINSNALRVKAAGINENHLAASVAGAGLSGGAGSPLAVNVDDSTLEINSDTLRQKDAGTTAAKLNTNVADQLTITGGAGAALAVQHAPLVKRTLVAGENFAANTSFLVRWALTGETAGRVYKADKDASASLKYNAIGIVMSAAGVTAGNNIDVIVIGEHTLGSSDTPFAVGDVGKEVFVGSAGAFILGAALAGSADEAAFVVGAVQTTTKIWIDFKHLRGIA